MNRKISLGLVSFVIGLGLFGCAEVYAETGTSATVSTQGVAELQAKIRVLMQQIESLQAKLRAIQSSTSTLPIKPGLHLGEIRKNICFGARNDDDVRVVQMKLKESGHFKEEVTGNYFMKTDEAVRMYQKEHGLPPVECVGPRTREAFKLHPPASREPKITPMAFRIFHVGIFAEQHLMVHGFSGTSTPNWSVAQGSLPAGLSLCRRTLRKSACLCNSRYSDYSWFIRIHNSGKRWI
jgi:hypothetical protein